ncbi:hypothetical protein N2603_18660 [Bradyrhizobium huanghuaihaiense]|uniref:hypothetical protein n=1 Tax=Bradyrhizobium huanghuaihaiense TaxID=990078 RepID=UPI0021AA4CD1|nr:hypothetical protein [Bradyrhizobium sp. CB3035]UWU80412.1 hypothetical protein N2603_18660 [Bradyrhizobium sp. CB3035]
MKTSELALGALSASAFWALASIFLPISNANGRDIVATAATVFAASILAATAATRMAHRSDREVLLAAQAPRTITQEVIEKFEKRSRRLKQEAWIFLAGVLALLVAGALAVVYAKNLTVGDIGALTLDEKIAAEQQEKQKTQMRVKQIEEGAVKNCNAALRFALQPWVVSRDSMYEFSVSSRDRYSSNLPTGDRLVELIERRLDDGQREGRRGSRRAVEIRGCGAWESYYIFVDPEQLPDFRSKLAGKIFASAEDSALILEVGRLAARADDLDSLASRYNLEKIEADLEKAKRGDVKQSEGTKGSPNKSDDLFLTLLQTSITRFGLLAVVGFFVSILVSLYRYNIRLAAFYLARADALRLFAPDIEISDFVLLSTALSPTVEFGRTPPPPVTQLIDLVKSAKEVAK